MPIQRQEMKMCRDQVTIVCVSCFERRYSLWDESKTHDAINYFPEQEYVVAVGDPQT